MDSEEQDKYVRAGTRLTIPQFRKLEHKLNSDDLKMQLKFLGFFWKRKHVDLTLSYARFQTIIWLIDNFPEYSEHIQMYMTLDDYPSRLWLEAGEHWRTQIEKRRDNCSILFNAAMFFINKDFDQGQTLLKRAMTIDSTNGHYPTILCQKFYNQFSTDGDLNKKLAIQVLENGFKASEIGFPFFQAAWNCHSVMAQAAYILEQYDLSESLTNKMPLGKYTDPPAHEFKHAMLGLIAVRRSDISTAVANLWLIEDEAKMLTVTHQLLRELFDHGAQQPVVDFLGRFLRIPIDPAEAFLWLEDIGQGLSS
jgi:hypothetical protein